MKEVLRPWRAASTGWRYHALPAVACNDAQRVQYSNKPTNSSTRPIKPATIASSTSQQPSRHARPVSTTHRHNDPTICALSTGPGRAAIAVIRISGPASLNIYHSLCPDKKPPKPRYATVRTLYEPDKAPSPGTVLDACALVLYFPGPRTSTGEEVLELHVHGGAAVVRAVLAAIPKCVAGGGGGRVRYAGPGEFTRRAFMNDRLDLTQVEALGDTLAATTEQQRRLSVRGTTGSLAKRYEAWRQRLLYARGELEALIDFSEDQHFDESPAALCASVSSQIQTLKQTVQIHRQNAVRGELLRNGISISLLGAPNAGKSSLLNRIVGREAAIVSQEAGTTRDVVEIGLDLGGYLCRVGDTAGLRKAREEGTGGGVAREGVGEIEGEGMRRAKARAEASDIVIVVLSFEEARGMVGLHLDEEVIATAAGLVRTKDNVVVAINKTDKVTTNILEAAIQQTLQSLPNLTSDKVYPISCKAAEAASKYSNAVHPDAGGIQAFLQGLILRFHQLTTALAATPEGAGTTASADLSIWQESLGATERHRLLLEECVGCLDAFLAEVRPEHQADTEADIVVAAEHLRGAADRLAKITGRGEAGDVEEVLGVVFEKFCVGK